MTTKTQEVHYCDYCNKHLFRKKAMQKHEDRCYANPINQPKCYECQHFNVEMRDDNNGDLIRGTWVCKKKNIELISIVALKKGKDEIYLDRTVTPIECSDFCPFKEVSLDFFGNF